MAKRVKVDDVEVEPIKYVCACCVCILENCKKGVKAD
jgi:hypothetical protein